MTTYYKGNNIGLSYNAEAGTWAFNNTPQDFIDPNAFSTPDPKFPTAPTTPTTPTEPEQDPCPPGYIYDKALKQCVPDPNYQNPFKQDNQGGGQDDNNTGTGLDPFNQASQYTVLEDGTPVTGGKSLVPTKDSGIDYSIFNYGTYAPTRAQMNEFMLINYGLDKGWLSYDNEKDAYRKIQFQEQIDPTAREIVGNNWALNLLQKDAYRNYKDYFELLEKGHQPSSDENVWKKFIRGNAVYSLTGGMVFREMSTRGGKNNSPVTYINFSEDRYIDGPAGQRTFIKGFKTKIKEAMSIKDDQGNVKGIIDRDGNVNVKADKDGGYYDSNGNYTGADGSKGSNLLKGMQYLINLKNSGIELPDNLKKRLFKGINSKALTPAQKATYASQLGYTSWNDVKKDLDTAVSNDDWWKKDDTNIIPIDDGKPITTQGDTVSDDGTITDPSGDTYTPTGDGQGYTFESGSDTSYTTGGQGSGYMYDPSGSGSGTNYGTGRGGSSYNTSSSSSTGSSSTTDNNPYSGSYGSADYNKDKPDDAGGV